MFSLPALESEFQLTQISFSASVNFNCSKCVFRNCGEYVFQQVRFSVFFFFFLFGCCKNPFFNMI
jgi:hypothetical protein